uniref:DUF2029 domain-containing protein n=1 Tax=Eiseniibacteriota bacterium TaxID=2212470 RepID=A0A832I148_UNCEI
MRPRPPLRLVAGYAGGATGGATPLAAALEFAALGLGLTACVALLARAPAWFWNLGTFQALFLAAFGFHALALARLRRYAALPGVGLAVLAVAVAARLLLLPVPPSLSGDIHRYVWEGRVLAAGGNPYRQAPLDPALAPLRDARVWPHVNHPHLSTIYPPLAEAGFALVAALAPGVAAMKLWIVLHDVGLVVVLLAWARRRRVPEAAVLAYAWNPLVLVEYAGTGHNDPTALVWLALAFMLRERRPVAAALALAAAVLVKLVPLLALPFLLRRWPWRARLAALLPLAAGLAAFWALTRGTDSGLSAYWGSWRNNELAFHYLDRALGGHAAARAATLAAVAAAAAWAWRRNWAPERATALLVATALLLAPAFHPWYLGWVLVFLPFAPSAAWTVLSATCVLNYGVLATPAEGRVFHLPLAWRWVEYGIPLAVGLAARAARVAARRKDETWSSVP